MGAAVYSVLIPFWFAIDHGDILLLTLYGNIVYNMIARYLARVQLCTVCPTFCVQCAKICWGCHRLRWHITTHTGIICLPFDCNIPSKAG